MAIKVENLSYVYSTGTAFEKQALKNVTWNFPTASS